MWSRTELKTQGRTAFKLNYWRSVLVSLLVGMITAGSTTASVSNTFNNTDSADGELESSLNDLVSSVQALPESDRIKFIAAFAGGLTVIIIISVLLKIFVSNPLLVGCNAFFKENVIQPPAGLGSISDGFRNYMHTFVTLFLTDLFITLWTILLVIPGIIKMYSYRLVPYLLKDRPELSATDTIRLSRDMMRGNKWAAFMLDLSFLGWALLSILTLGIVGVFWYSPYKCNTDAALYLKIKQQRHV